MADKPTIKRGPLKGRRIESAPTSRVDQFRSIADHFLSAVFGFDPHDVYITDESAVTDFKGVNGLETVEAIKAKIQEVYGFVPASLLLVDIFGEIQWRSEQGAL
jgi:hypothetical protein